MNVLMVDKFFFVQGGVERYLFDWKALLEERGHTVVPFSMRHPRNQASPWSEYFVDHVSYELPGLWRRILAGPRVAARMLYSTHARRRLGMLLARTRVDVAHLHMIDHQISPSILHTLRAAGVPVLQTLHNYKLVCPNYLLYNPRTRAVCEKCLDGRFHHPALERCHKDSRAAGALVGLETFLHRATGIYEKNVDVFHAPSRFLESVLRGAGVGSGKLRHLPLFVPIHAYEPSFVPGDYLLYVGRLSPEKGVRTLLEAVKGTGIPLRIVGEGPERTALETLAAAGGLEQVRFEGYRTADDLRQLVRGCRFAVVPSECYENAPLAIYECFAYGKPVVGSRLGGVPELVEERRTGRLFEAGNALELREILQELFPRTQTIEEMGRAARLKAETDLGPERHYETMSAWFLELSASARRAR